MLIKKGLAYWIMDDGGKGNKNEIILHTRCFLKKEVLLLQEVLKTKFNLKSRIREKTKNQWIIIIPIKQEISIKILVMPYMHVSMLYKIE